MTRNNSLLTVVSLLFEKIGQRFVMESRARQHAQGWLKVEIPNSSVHAHVWDGGIEFVTTCTIIKVF